MRIPIQMTGYKDRVWCNQICGNKSCDRNFTEEEEKFATTWWGDVDFPLGTTDFKSDNCGYTPIETTKELTDE